MGQIRDIKGWVFWKRKQHKWILKTNKVLTEENLPEMWKGWNGHIKKHYIMTQWKWQPSTLRHALMSLLSIKKRSWELPLIRRWSQDGGVGRTWAHLLPWAHKNHSCSQSNHGREPPADEQKRVSTTKDIMKEPWRDGWRGQRRAIVKTQTQGILWWFSG